MRTWTKSFLAAAAILLVFAAAVLASPTPTGKIIDLKVQASKVGGGSLGSFNVKPSVPIPVTVGSTYHLVLMGVSVTGPHHLGQVPVNATFSIGSGRGRISIVSQSANTVDVKVLHGGGQLKYVAAPGHVIARGLASGRISFQ